MFAKKSIIVLFIAGLLMSMTAAHAQAEVTSAFATVIDNELWIYPAEDDPVRVETGDIRGISSTDWSPDRSHLAYIAYNSEFSPELFVYSVEQQSSFRLAEKVETGFPATFTQDGTRILYTQFSTESQPENGIYKVDVISAPVFGRGPTITAGTFDMGVGCGGGSNIPADWVYNAETEGFGGFSLVLEETSFGIIHSAECGGSRTSLLNPETGEDTLISENFGRVKVSPDRTKAAGIELNVRVENDEVIRESRLLIVDLATREISELAISHEPDQLAWSADGSKIFYSAKEATGDLYADLAPEQRTALDTALGFSYGELPSYTSSIWQIDLASGEETQVLRGDAYAVGRMIAVDESLYFSLIPNLGAWVEALISGNIRFDSDFNQQLQYVLPTVHRVDLTMGEISEVGTNLGQFTPQ
jgi:dipeptidyl aminopeptidase/acylaminoacyl peptidase